MFLTLMWIAVAVGMVTIITAAMKVQNTSLCKGYEVRIIGFEEDKLFTSEVNIVKLLKAATKGDIKGQRISEFNLPGIEDLLEQSAWVYNAELYFDNMDILRVNVTERKPLARVFTNVGESFYIDEAGRQIPLSERISLDVPVFTGYPNKKIMNAEDSTLVQNVIATASFISTDPFWSSQVSQIDIGYNGIKGWQMEMIPVVGNHRVQLGDGSDIATKFHRLFLFYDQVLKRKGFDKYKTIDVQYNGQVVGVKENYTKIDSIQLRKNIESLLEQSRMANELISETPNIGLSNYIMDTAVAAWEADEPMSEAPLEMSESEANAVATEKAKAAKIEIEKDVKTVEDTEAEVSEDADQPGKGTVKKPVPVRTTKPAIKKETATKEAKPTVKKTEVKASNRKSDTKKTTAAKLVETKKKTN